jgi:hypothetical protein
MAKQPETREISCSFCGARSARKLIAGPRICICDECVARAAEELGAGNTVEQPTAALTWTPSSPPSGGALSRMFRKTQRPIPPHCNFCGKSPAALVQPPSELGTSALICGECLLLCQQLIAEELGAQV